jgi:hypothetical protein
MLQRYVVLSIPVCPFDDGSCPQILPDRRYFGEKRRPVYGTGLALTLKAMSARAVVLAVVGTGCIIAAGVGGFVAMRLSAPARGAEAIQASAAVTSAPAPAVPAAEPSVLVNPPASADVSPAPVEPTAAASLPKPRAEAPRATSTTTKTQKSAAAASAPQPTPEPTLPAVTTPVPTPAGDVAPPPPPDETVSAPVETPKPRFEELTVVENSVIGIHLVQSISSATAKVEDKVTAKVTRDVMVGGRTAIPAGATLEGNVTYVNPGGKFKERSRLGIKFTSLVLPDNTRQSIQTEALFRDGEAPAGEATSKVGASAAIGAILGAVIGGKKGAAIGAGAGAAGGTAAVAAGGKNDAVFAANAPLTVRLTSPVNVMIERNPQEIR